ETRGQDRVASQDQTIVAFKEDRASASDVYTSRKGQIPSRTVPIQTQAPVLLHFQCSSHCQARRRSEIDKATTDQELAAHRHMDRYPYKRFVPASLTARFGKDFPQPEVLHRPAALQIKCPVAADPA